MTDNTTPVAKSLHTVKVIQQVAAHIQATFAANGQQKSRPDAIAAAMTVLGLSGRPDPYELQEKALRLWK